MEGLKEIITLAEAIQYKLEDLYNVIELIIQQDDEDLNYPDEIKLKYDLIRNGINLKIPLPYLTKKEWYTEYPNSKRVSILGHGKFPIMLFYDEIKERERICREIIIGELEEQETIQIQK